MRLEHPIFHTPHEVQVPLHDVEVPAHYAHYSLEPQPATLPAWRVFERPEPPPGTEHEPTLDLVGLVSDGFGFEDSPDCEWISSGINSKGPDALAIGRQANFFLWGFAADPSLFTPSARDVFVNAVVYMKQFDGQRPLVRSAASPREWVGVELWVADQARTDPGWRSPGQTPEAAVEETLQRYFGPATLERTGADTAVVRAWFLDHFEQITTEEGEDGRRQHVVDVDLVELGVSNRKLELFDAIVERWSQKPDDELCRRVLGRYVPDESFAAPAELVRWVTEHRDTLFFSDAGGFRWFVAEGARRESTPPAPGGTALRASGEHVLMQASLVAPAAEGEPATLSLVFRFDEGWHSYAPTTSAGFPLRPALHDLEGLEAEGSMNVPAASSTHRTPDGEEAWLTGAVTYVQPLRVLDGHGTLRLRVAASVVVCDEQRCLPPQSLELTLELPPR